MFSLQWRYNYTFFIGEYMNSLMLDLETLGQSPGNIIFEIAAVQFDLTTGLIGNKITISINKNDSLLNGFTEDIDTINWWKQQSVEAQEQLNIKTNNGDTVLNSLLKFTLFIKENFNNKDFNIFGRGPSFDCSLLKIYYEKMKLELPWNFRRELCVRTYEFLRPEIKKSITPVGTEAHTGIQDCLNQIAYVTKIHQILM